MSFFFFLSASLFPLVSDSRMASTAWSAICGHLSELTALPRDRWRWCGLIALSFSLSPVHSASLRPPIGHSVRDSDSHQRCQMEPTDSNLEICRWRITGRVLGFSTHKRRDYIEIPVLHDHMDHLYTHTHTHRHSRDIYTPTDTHTHTHARGRWQTNPPRQAQKYIKTRTKMI